MKQNFEYERIESSNDQDEQRRFRLMGSQVLLTFSQFSDVKPIMERLTESNISFFPRTWDGCAETSLRIGRDRYFGLREIVENLDVIVATANSEKPADVS
jgi:hypothetical protein